VPQSIAKTTKTVVALQRAAPLRRRRDDVGFPPPTAQRRPPAPALPPTPPAEPSRAPPRRPSSTEPFSRLQISLTPNFTHSSNDGLTRGTRQPLRRPRVAPHSQLRSLGNHHQKGASRRTGVSFTNGFGVSNRAYAFNYDGMGNVTGDNLGITYTYDAEGRPVTAAG